MSERSIAIKKHRVGVVGLGFLGNALINGFSLHAHIKAYDKFKPSNTFEETIRDSEFIFLCLPTPMYEDNGEIDLSVLDEVLGRINDFVEEGNDKIIIIKSTVIPGTCRSFSKKYVRLNIVDNPEYLTARNSLLDFIFSTRIVLGGDSTYTGRVEDLYRYRFGNSILIYKTNWETAELSKYGINLFFAVKISYFNFIYQMCQKFGINYDEVRDMIASDGRVARSHMDVPGQDSLLGYGGHCFVKDINAMIKQCNDIGVNSELIKASWSQNLKDRPSKDWENLGPTVISKRKK